MGSLLSLTPWRRQEKGFFEDCQQPGDLFCFFSHVKMSKTKASPRMKAFLQLHLASAACQWAWFPSQWAYAWGSTVGGKPGKTGKYMYMCNGLRQQLTLSSHNITDLDSICSHEVNLLCLKIAQISLCWTAVRSSNTWCKTHPKSTITL